MVIAMEGRAEVGEGSGKEWSLVRDIEGMVWAGEGVVRVIEGMLMAWERVINAIDGIAWASDGTGKGWSEL